MPSESERTADGTSERSNTRRSVLRTLGVAGVLPFSASDSIRDAAVSATRATRATNARAAETRSTDPAAESTRRDRQANAPVIGWRHDFDGTVTDLAPADDGVVAAVGKSLVELGSDGNATWSRTYDLDYDIVAVGKTTSGFGFTAGPTSVDFGEATTIVSVDAGGAEQWSTVLGGEGSQNVWFAGVVVGNQDGGFAVGGNVVHAEPNAFMYEYDSCGVMERRIDTEFEDETGSGVTDALAIANGDGYALTGFVRPVTHPLFLGRGSVRTYKDHAGRSTAIVTGVDDGYVIGGTVETDGESSGAFLLAADADGSERWYHDYGDLRSFVDIGDVAATSDGYAFTTSSGRRAWLVGVDPEGTVRWERELGDGRAGALVTVDEHPVVAVGSSVVSVARS